MGRIVLDRHAYYSTQSAEENMWTKRKKVGAGQMNLLNKELHKFVYACFLCHKFYLVSPVHSP
jgi:hypothetical protein